MSAQTTKILYVITKSNYGGAQKYVYELATEAQKRGYTVEVASGGTGEPNAETGLLIEKLEAAGIETRMIHAFQRDMSAWQDCKAFFELAKICLRSRPDTLHLTSSKAGGLGTLVGRILRVKNIIFTSHGLTMDETWRPWWQRTLITIATWGTLTLAHHTILINQDTYARARKMPGLQNKVHCVPNGIKEFSTIAFDHALQELSLTLPKDVVIIGGIGELHPNKRWSELVIALRLLPENVHVVIFGEGEERAALERLAKHHTLSDRVHLLGHVPEAKKYLSLFTIFILPSAKEGLPYVLLEAGLAHKPVIASNLPGNQDIIESGKNGLLIDPKSAEFSTSIAMLIRDEGLRNRLAHELHTKVTSTFSVQKMFADTFALYPPSSKDTRRLESTVTGR